MLALLNGGSSAFFFPASSGIVPQTVPPALQQQANATLRLGLNGTNILGAALGGLLVAASSPGWAIAVDAASYGLAAIAIAAMHLPPGLRVHGSTVIHELREGWSDFWSRGWLWAIVLQFGIVNAFESGAMGVLGPTVAKRHLGGAAAWGGVLTATSIGLVLSGVLMLHWRPRRILLVATLAVFPMTLPLLALARPAPLAVVIAAGFIAGFSVEIFGVLWDTDDAAGDSAGEALAALFVRRARLVGADADCPRGARPGRSDARHAHDTARLRRARRRGDRARCCSPTTCGRSSAVLLPSSSRVRHGASTITRGATRA